MEDQADFDKHDKDKNGALDLGEFKAIIQEKYRLNDVEVKQVFEKWDIDQGGSIGIYEWVTLAAELRAERYFQKQKVEAEVLLASLDYMLPSDACFACTFYFGLGCCCCTLGLSLIPLCCVLSSANKRITDKHFEQEMKQVRTEAHDVAKERSKVNTKRFLLGGPDSCMVRETQDMQLTATPDGALKWKKPNTDGVKLHTKQWGKEKEPDAKTPLITKTDPSYE